MLPCRSRLKTAYLLNSRTLLPINVGLCWVESLLLFGIYMYSSASTYSTQFSQPLTIAHPSVLLLFLHHHSKITWVFIFSFFLSLLLRSLSWLIWSESVSNSIINRGVLRSLWMKLFILLFDLFIKKLRAISDDRGQHFNQNLLRL